MPSCPIVRWPGASLALLALAACGPFPRDVAGTTEQAREERTIRVVVHPSGTAADVKIAALLTLLARETGAAVTRVDLAGERPMLALESGDVDLVVTPFDPKSPWSARVAAGPPLADAGVWRLVPLTRNGENRWAAIVDRAARRVADAP